MELLLIKSRLPIKAQPPPERMWKWSGSVMSYSWRPHELQPTRLLHPWDFPGKSTGVGCYFLLQPPPETKSNIGQLLPLLKPLPPPPGDSLSCTKRLCGRDLELVFSETPKAQNTAHVERNSTWAESDWNATCTRIPQESQIQKQTIVSWSSKHPLNLH